MPLTPATLPPGWTPYADGSWPRCGSWVAVLHPDGTGTPLVHYTHWDMLRVPPLYGMLGRAVVGWRPAEGPHPTPPKAAGVKGGGKCW